ncbi:hypothetical protein LCGC14_0969880 [marine sediment metagenome]|uniref:Uncharacterized protein n=1 Tax=marine sediment metagenome TaxID=412755 RepID=A0A0F9NGF9_9ZZZZ
MKKIELIIIRANDIEKYYIADIKFSLKTRNAKFTLASSDKKMPDITMVITYINLVPNNNLFMVMDIDTEKLGFMVSAVAEADLGNVGKIITKSLYFLFSQKRGANYEKETRMFKGYRSELGVTD